MYYKKYSSLPIGKSNLNLCFCLMSTWWSLYKISLWSPCSFYHIVTLADRNRRKQALNFRVLQYVYIQGQRIIFSTNIQFVSMSLTVYSDFHNIIFFVALSEIWKWLTIFMQSTNSNHSDEIILKAVFLSQIWLLNFIMHYNYKRKSSSTKYTVSRFFTWILYGY